MSQIADSEKLSFVAKVTFKGRDIQNFWEGGRTLHGWTFMHFMGGDLITP